MISPKAITDFLSRSLRDSNKTKLFSDAALTKKIENLSPKPKLNVQLRTHQKACFLLGLLRKRYLLLLDMGLGKTLITLAIFHYLKQLNRKPKALVLVPGSSNVGAWCDEVKKHTDLSVQGVDADGYGNRMMQIRGSADITVITYMGLIRLLSDSEEIVNDDGEVDDKKKWVLNKSKLKEIQTIFNFFVADEASTLRKKSSLMAKACRAISWSCEHAYALTGTPQGSDPIDLWSLFYTIDKGETLGPTLGLYREAFFKKQANYWTAYDYKFDESKRYHLNRMLRHNSIRYDDGECADLPPLIEIMRPVVMPKEAFTYYDALIMEIRKSRGNFQECQASFHRLRQITSGYLSVKGANDDKVQITFKDRPKLDGLLELLDEIPKDAKIVVWVEYRLTLAMIVEALKKAKINHITLFSGTKGSDKQSVADRLAKPGVRVLVSSSAGAYGLNLQVATYSIWFERPADIILYKQERKRLHRIGQTKTVRLIDLYVKGSVDEKLIKGHEAGESLFAAIVDGRENLEKFS